MEDETAFPNQNLMLVSTPESPRTIPLFIHSFSVALNIQELFKFLCHCTINCTASNFCMVKNTCLFTRNAQHIIACSHAEYT